MTQPHVEPLIIHLIKEKHDGKSDNCFVTLKLRRDPTSITSDLYEFKMSFFDNGEPEEFLLFVHNFNTTLTESGTLEAGAKYQYLRTIAYGEALCQFYLLSADIKGTENLNVDYIIRGLAQYPPPVNFLSKYKHAMRRRMKKMCILIVRRYAVHLIDLNEYLASFKGMNLTGKMGVTKLNETPLKSIPNTCYKHAYVQGFDCESIDLKKAVNMFERMEMAESIFEGVVEPSY